MIIRFIALVAFAFSVSSCANYFIRKNCESLNWYQVGQDIAMRGERVSGDEQVSQCRKVEAEMSESDLDRGFKAGMSKYCQPETVFQTGKSGELFNPDLCDTSNMGLLQKRHSDGLKAYCTDGNTAGLSGKKYKNVCPADLEKNFLPPYRAGRKKFLEGKIQVAETKKKELAVEIDRLSYEKRLLDSRRSILPIVPTGQTDPYANERSSLESRIRSVESELYQRENTKRQLDKEIGEYQSEVVTLG